MDVSDFNKLVKLFDEFGIGYRKEGRLSGDKEIVCKEGDAKIEGYALFCAYFTFDKEGKFSHLSILE